jgi:hypothetical protein
VYEKIKEGQAGTASSLKKRFALLTLDETFGTLKSRKNLA